jgi:hypothetical protein
VDFLWHVAAGDAELRAGHDPVPVARVSLFFQDDWRECQVHDHAGVRYDT